MSCWNQLGQRSSKNDILFFINPIQKRRNTFYDLLYYPARCLKILIFPKLLFSGRKVRIIQCIENMWLLILQRSNFGNYVFHLCIWQNPALPYKGQITSCNTSWLKKVIFTLEQAVDSHIGRKCITILFFNLGARLGW